MVITSSFDVVVEGEPPGSRYVKQASKFKSLAHAIALLCCCLAGVKWFDTSPPVRSFDKLEEMSMAMRGASQRYR
jgi:hypothetical protein